MTRFAIGPMVMMKFVCKTTCPYGAHLTVSMSPIMIDGTGMWRPPPDRWRRDSSLPAWTAPDHLASRWTVRFRVVKRNQMY